MRKFLHEHPDLDDKVILVTGGTGSFGRAFTRQLLANYQVRKLIIFSRDELKQYEMQNDPALQDHQDRLRYFIGDVRDYDRLEMAFRGVNYVIHAAALKQVPAAEYNPFECIKTNVHGAENVVNAAIRCGVEKVVALSTDKAANPINLYGASKLASDKIFIAGQRIAGESGPRFAVARYGNVIDSRGSVVPFFRSQLQNGCDFLPITDSRMTRFLITLRQGVDFVLSTLDLVDVGGELFIPKIPSIKIVDLARFMAPDVAQREIGVRPGEKLHEIMITEDDARSTIELSDRYVIKPEFWRPDAVYTNSKPVADRFVYASDTNDEWLDEAKFNEMLG